MNSGDVLEILQSRGELSLPMKVEDLSRHEGRSSRADYRALNMLRTPGGKVRRRKPATPSANIQTQFRPAA